MADTASHLPLWEYGEEIKTIQQGLVFFQDVGMSIRNLAQRTRAEYSRDVTGLVKFLEARGVTTLDRVRLKHLQLYARDLEKRTLSPSSRNRKVDAIRSFFRFLHEQEIIKFDVAEHLIPPPLVEREPRVLTEEEYQRLLSACAHNRRDQAIIVLYLQTGMRLSELVRLKVSDIELPHDIAKDEEHAGFARISRSNGKTERIPLNYKACAALVAYLKERPAVPSPTLFLNRFEGPLSKRRVQYFVKEYLEQVGILDASVQTLRHTMAAHHVAQGTDLQIIQETLGVSLATTEKYLSMAKKTARKALQEHAL